MASSRNSHAFALCIWLIPLVLFGYAGWKAGTRPTSRVSTLWLSFWLIVYIALLKKIVYPFYFSPLRHLPQPGGDVFGLGHGPSLIERPPGRRILRSMQDTPNDGMILVRGFFLIRSLIILTTPEALADVLTAKAYDWVKPSAARFFLERIVGNGLIIVEGKQHKMQRKAVTPAFHGKHINNLVPVFWQKALEFVDTIGREMHVDAINEKTGGTIEISAIASRVTLDIIGVASLGKDFNTLKNADDELAEDYSKITDPANRRLGLHAATNMILGKMAASRLLPKTDRLIQVTSERLRTTCRQLLADKRAELEKNPAGNVDILSTLLNNGSLNDDELVDQLLTFLAAGHETTASALTWATYELCRNPEMQDKLRAELRSNPIVTGGQKTLSAADLDSLPYLNGVCMETLRIWATVPVTSRVAIRDTSITGQHIPKGSEVIIAPCAINKLPALWSDDAAKFNPDRWVRNDGNLTGGSKSPYGLITFLHGPRSCIGQGFAKGELKCLLAALISKYEISLDDPTQKVMTGGVVTIKPRDGLVLRLKELKEGPGA